MPTRFHAIAGLSLLAGLSWIGPVLSTGLDERLLKNETPHIVSQCYTRTVDDQGRVITPVTPATRVPMRPIISMTRICS